MNKTVTPIKSAKDESLGYIERFTKLTPRVFLGVVDGGAEYVPLAEFNRDGAKARRYFTSAIKSLDIIGG